MQATEKRKAGQQRQPATENTFFKLQAQCLEEFVALHPSEWRVRDTRLSCPPREVRGMILGARKQSPVLVLTKERFLQIVGERNRDMLWSEVFADLDSDFNGAAGWDDRAGSSRYGVDLSWLPYGFCSRDSLRLQNASLEYFGILLF